MTTDRVIDLLASLRDGFCDPAPREYQDITDRRYTTYELDRRAGHQGYAKKRTAAAPRSNAIRFKREACKRPAGSGRSATSKSKYRGHPARLSSPRQLRQRSATQYLGELVMQQLRALDQVAFVRFASVYREFKDVRDFVDELEPMLEEQQRPR